MKRIRKLLVANRGEIALRVLRSAREMGLATVAVYSDCDRLAPHVLIADEAYPIGPCAAADSYLQGQKIVEVARKAGVDALHPGYGFLSENPEFARLTDAGGMVFVGPDADSMQAMGHKVNAKKIARDAGVPCVEGSDGPVQSISEARRIAERIGYPVLFKASAGGGGKGMRIVRAEDQLSSAFERARSEAGAAFGDNAVFVEKYIDAPRHIEIQILADHHGNILYFPERDCSVQRRYQKVIEESPSVLLDDDLRAHMGEAAVRIARACGYTNAGTVEFIVDKDRNYYFLEMNARLQVEHPVTELITGQDLVKEQLRIADGSPLALRQEQIEWRGHAIELRVYAEDPESGFLPDSGVITEYSPPSGIGIRVDDGYRSGMEVTVHYDPLLSKLVAHGRDRQEAIHRLKRAIAEYRISGIRNTLDFGRRVLDHSRFLSGDVDTNFVAHLLKETDDSTPPDDEISRAGAIFAAAHYAQQSGARRTTAPSRQTSQWKNRSWQ